MNKWRVGWRLLSRAKISFLHLAALSWRTVYFLPYVSWGCQPFLVNLSKRQGPRLHLGLSVTSLPHAYQLASERNVPVVKLVIAPNSVFILSVGFLEPPLLLIEWAYCGAFTFL